MEEEKKNSCSTSKSTQSFIVLHMLRGSVSQRLFCNTPRVVDSVKNKTIFYRIQKTFQTWQYIHYLSLSSTHLERLKNVLSINQLLRIQPLLILGGSLEKDSHIRKISLTVVSLQWYNLVNVYWHM